MSKLVCVCMYICICVCVSVRLSQTIYAHEREFRNRAQTPYFSKLFKKCNLFYSCRKLFEQTHVYINCIFSIFPKTNKNSLKVNKGAKIPPSATILT